jgi:hypothetical protein
MADVLRVEIDSNELSGFTSIDHKLPNYLPHATPYVQEKRTVSFGGPGEEQREDCRLIDGVLGDCRVEESEHRDAGVRVYIVYGRADSQDMLRQEPVLDCLIRFIAKAFFGRRIL